MNTEMRKQEDQDIEGIIMNRYTNMHDRTDEQMKTNSRKKGKI